MLDISDILAVLDMDLSDYDLNFWIIGRRCSRKWVILALYYKNSLMSWNVTYLNIFAYIQTDLKTSTSTFQS